MTGLFSVDIVYSASWSKSEALRTMGFVIESVTVAWDVRVTPKAAATTLAAVDAPDDAIWGVIRGASCQGVRNSAAPVSHRVKRCHRNEFRRDPISQSLHFLFAVLPTFCPHYTQCTDNTALWIRLLPSIYNSQKPKIFRYRMNITAN